MKGVSQSKKIQEKYPIVEITCVLKVAVYCSAVKLLGTGMKNLNPDCLLTII